MKCICPPYGGWSLACPVHGKDDPFAKPYVGECDGCGRKVWTEKEVGTVCKMTQPNGKPCHGPILRV